MQVAKKTTAKEVWDCLKARFIGADHLRDARMQSLKSDFDALHMQEGETPDQYAGKLAGISVRYSSLGGTLNDATLVKKLFNTVPRSLPQLCRRKYCYWMHPIRSNSS
jgi:hypothetical protein